jgi:hypothetical protein
VFLCCCCWLLLVLCVAAAVGAQQRQAVEGSSELQGLSTLWATTPAGPKRLAAQGCWAQGPKCYCSTKLWGFMRSKNIVLDGIVTGLNWLWQIVPTEPSEVAVSVFGSEGGEVSQGQCIFSVMQEHFWGVRMLPVQGLFQIQQCVSCGQGSSYEAPQALSSAV